MDDKAYHKHNNIDGTPLLDPAVSFLGLPIYRTEPIHDALEGTPVLYWDGSTTYRIYYRINKGWHYATLT